MKEPIIRTCLTCRQPFQIRRKNQFYCSTSCRTDANNAVAKQRYATFREESPKMQAINERLKSLQEYVRGLTIVVQVSQVDRDTIIYQGRTYRRSKRKPGQSVKGVHINSGGGILMPGGSIIYRTEGSQTGSDCWEYLPEK